MVPNLTESVSVDANGVLHITMTNVDLEKAYLVEAVLLGKEVGEIKAEIVTGHMQDKNTFENPDLVKPAPFEDCSIQDNCLTIRIPSKSVVLITLEPEGTQR